jgi:uncharacterized protein (TIGR03663 family)
MKERGFFGLLFLVAIAAALFLRCGDLSLRPLHNDEAINAFKVRKLWTTGEFRYDPHEYHGPTLYYASIPVLKAVSWARPDQPDEAGLRSVPLVFGVGLVLLAWGMTAGMGRVAAGMGALFVAVSPAFVYFSRYYIHEILLVFFTGLTFVALGRYRERPCVGWAAGIGAGIGLMYATKETFVFALGAMGMGILGAALGLGQGISEGWGSRCRRLGTEGWAQLRRVPASHWGLGLGMFVVVAGILFTSFLTNPAGALDALRTYLIWFERAGGGAQTPHVHGWSFYGERLIWYRFRGGPVWTEAALVAFALVGAVSGWVGSGARERRGEWARFLTGYSLSLAAVYSILPYKTPWCLLGFHHGLALLAGLGVVFLAGTGERSGWPRRVAVGLLVAAATVHLAWQGWRASREFAADFRNPHVYGHTSPDMFNLLEQIEELSGIDPGNRSMPVSVVAPDDNYWPLPWYLRRYDRVGWWSKLPEPLAGSVVVVATKVNASLEEKSGQAWIQAGMFELRPRYFVELYVEAGLWRRFLEARAAARR